MNGPLGERTVAGLLEAIAAKTPVPGGGAVAALVGALGAALANMVVAYSAGRKSLAAHAALHEEAATALAALAESALALADADAEAYAALAELWKLPEDDPLRRDGWEDAVTAAIEAPRAVIEVAVSTFQWLERLADTTNPNLASDLAIAAVLAETAVRAAAWNVRINLPHVQDDRDAARWGEAAEHAVAEAQRRAEALERQVGA